MPKTLERVTFPGSTGAPLAGRLERPAGEPLGVALFAHCFTCGKDLLGARRISQELADRGFLVLRFDFTGLGESAGDFANTTFTSNVADLIAAADWLRDHHGAPSLLLGHSLGGPAVICAARDIPEVLAVATVGAPSDPAHVAGVFGDDVTRIEQDGCAEVQLAGRPFTVRRGFLDDIRAQPLAARLANLRAALLILHSPQDNTVSIDNAAALYQAARHPKSFVTLDGANHLLTRLADAAYVGEVVAAWASRYLPARPKLPKPTHHDDVEVRSADGLAQHIAVGDHRLRADEPLDVGGTNTGPAPYDLLLAGLGACTSMTLRLYADRKGWPLEDVTVHLRHQKIHATDCADCETKTGRIDRIERVVDIAGDLDDTQRARLLEIADRCPVHRTLHSEVIIDTVAG